MKTAIWDLDGTIIDSYPYIVKALSEIALEQKIDISDSEILSILKLQSSKELFELFVKNCKVDLSSLKEVYEKKLKVLDSKMILIEGVKQTLSALKQAGVRHMIYTHKGNTTFEVLKGLKIDEYFEEVVTIENGFKRKPDPEALVYLKEKYDLTKEGTYYVGDRLLDVLSANRAGLKSIFYNPEGLTLSEAMFNCKTMKEVQNSILEE